MGKRKIDNGRAVLTVLGVDPMKVAADSLTLEPWGDDWLVRWDGLAVLDAKAAEALFGGDA
jgi:hypothetical protein